MLAGSSQGHSMFIADQLTSISSKTRTGGSLCDSVVLGVPDNACEPHGALLSKGSETGKMRAGAGRRDGNPRSRPFGYEGGPSPSSCAGRERPIRCVLQRDTNTGSRAGNILYTAVSQFLAGGLLESDFPDNNYIFKKRITETREDGLIPTRQEHEL